MIQRTLTADEIKYLPASLGVSSQADIEAALLARLNADIATMVNKNKTDETTAKVTVLVASKDPRVDALYEELKPVIKEVAEK